MRLKAILPAIFVLTAILIAGMSAVAYAQNSTSTPSSASLQVANALDRFVSIVLPAIAVALVTSGLGYLKENNPGTFDPVKFIATLIIALFVGVCTSLLGMSYNDAVTYAANGALTVWIYWVAQLISNKLRLAVPTSTTPPITPPATTTPPVTTTPSVDMTTPATPTPTPASNPNIGGGVFMVKVVDIDGQPLQGINVEWTNSYRSLIDSTNANGEVNVGSLPTYRWRIEASGYQIIAKEGQIPAIVVLQPKMS